MHWGDGCTAAQECYYTINVCGDYAQRCELIDGFFQHLSWRRSRTNICVFIMVVAAAEVAVGLALIVMIYRNFKTTDINLFNKLKW